MLRSEPVEEACYALLMETDPEPLDEEAMLYWYYSNLLSFLTSALRDAVCCPDDYPFFVVRHWRAK
jgi:hypothetical protein